MTKDFLLIFNSGNFHSLKTFSARIKPQTVSPVNSNGILTKVIGVKNQKTFKNCDKTNGAHSNQLLNVKTIAGSSISSKTMLPEN